MDGNRDKEKIQLCVKMTKNYATLCQNDTANASVNHELNESTTAFLSVSLTHRLSHEREWFE